MPDTVVRGRSFEWLEGGQFLIWRARNEHPDFPDSISILGCDEPEGADAAGDAGGGCSLRYFDSRGISRRYALEAEAGVFRFSRDQPGFSQRFTGTLSADGAPSTAWRNCARTAPPGRRTCGSRTGESGKRTFQYPHDR